MTVFTFNGLTVDSANLTADDMPTQIFKEIFEICGSDVALSLLVNMTGVTIQVPTCGFRKIENKIFLKEYDGSTASIRRLAIKFKVTENYIREVIRSSQKDVPSPGQMNLFN